MTRLVFVDVDLQQKFLDGSLSDGESEKYFKVSQEESGREGLLRGTTREGLLRL